MPRTGEIKTDGDTAEATAEAALWRTALEGANALYESNRLDEARSKYDELVEANRYTGFACFAIGRIALARQDLDEALVYFDRSIDVEPTFFWSYYERFVLLHDRGDKLDASHGVLARQMAELDWSGVNATHVAKLEPCAHRLWDSEERIAGAGLLQKIWDHGAISELGLVRVLEASDDPRAQRRAAKALEGIESPGRWALKELAHYHGKRGDFEKEKTFLERLHGLEPADFPTLLSLVKVYANAGEPEKLEGLRQAISQLPPRKRSFLQLAIMVEKSETEPAFNAFREHIRLYAEAPKFIGIRLAYLLSDALQTSKRNQVLDFLLIYHGESTEIAIVQVNAAIRDQRWMDAKAIFDRHFEHVDPKPQNVRLAQIDILAFTGELQKAAEILESEAEKKGGRYPSVYTRSAIRIFGELGRWNDMVDVGLANLQDDTSYTHFFSPVVRAARKAGRIEELFEALKALGPSLNSGQTSALIATAEDLAEAGIPDVLAKLENIPLSKERENRIRLKSRAASPIAPRQKRLCIYYCTDIGYLKPALISLTSLAIANIGTVRDASIALVADAEAFPKATVAVEGLRRHLGLSIELLPAEQIVETSGALRTAYGIFTGGQSLSLAAYYRIFFAKYLAQRGEFDDALYIDSDTIVRRNLLDLFETDLSGPIMARPEIDRPEVRHAIALHGLKNFYFNSGVLRFDLGHPDLPRLLDIAVEKAIDPSVPLIFQDQCALNIAFDGYAERLPERFNFFRQPHDSSDDLLADDAVIVHYLDRPKPWDSLYRLPAREWFEWFDFVEHITRDDKSRTQSSPVAVPPETAGLA